MGWTVYTGKGKVRMYRAGLTSMQVKGWTDYTKGAKWAQLLTIQIRPIHQVGETY